MDKPVDPPLAEAPAGLPLRILLVDDDDLVVKGLGRRLAGLRRQWVVLTCRSAEEAIKSMRCDPPDALITDIKMPVQDGSVLLEHAASAHPACFRVVLSGYAEQNTVMRCLELCHKSFIKPYDAELLVNAIEAGIADLRSIPSHDLRNRISGGKSMRESPRAYREITELLDNQGACNSRIAQAIERDPALAAKVLKTANSAFFGRSQQVATINDAVSAIGVEAVRFVVLGHEVFAGGSHSPWHEALWKHSLQVADLSRKIAKVLGAPKDSAFTAGLLHDAGKLVMRDAIGHGAWLSIIRQGADCGLLPWVAEQNHFGASHAEVGAVLFSFWGLPADIVQATRWHHQPSRCPEDSARCAIVVHLANMLAHTWHDQTSEAPCDTLWLEERGIACTPGRWEMFREPEEEETHGG